MNINNSKNVNNVQNSKGFKKMEPNKIPTIAEEVKSALHRLYTSAERRVAENMSFAPVMETFKNSTKEFSVNEFIIKIIADPVDVRNSRRVLLEAEVPNSDYVASLTLTKGTKSEVLKTLAEDSFSQKVVGLLKEIDDATKNFEKR